MLIRQLKLTLILLVTLIWFIFIIPYFVVQTDFGANLVSRYLSQQSRYSFNIGHISHSLASPTEITLSDVSIIDKTTGVITLKTEKMTLGITPDTLWHNAILDYLVIQNGQINLTEKQAIPDLPIQRLQLNNMSGQFAYNDTMVEITHLSGGLKSATKAALTDPQQAVEFEFTAEKVKIADIDIQSFIISGLNKDDTLFYNNLGGSVQDGFFISKGKRRLNQPWQIDELQINHLHFQEDISVEQLASKLKMQIPFTINHFSLTDSSVALADFNIENANIELNNVSYDQQFIWQDTELKLNATSLIWHNELFFDPMLQIQLNPNQISIQKAMTKWREGFISFAGNWHNNQLTLTQLSLLGLNTGLPEDWLNDVITRKLPDYLSNINIKHLSLAPSIIVDTQAVFPSQFTYLEAEGHDLVIAQSQRLDLWQGDLTIKANHATINTVTLRYLDIAIKADTENNQRQLKMSLNALTDSGMIDAALTATPENQQITNLTIQGDGVDPQLLKLWHVIENPNEQHNFTLSLSGRYAPLNLHGQLTNKALNQLTDYPVKDNLILLN
ncbi:hypothetical protein RHO15_00555 [Utexia brackfieldae]|uniref:hypothetical protein n=1 Tax=Utexia brackfieldae TaxID=3074108 RepID=UPI00370D93EA